MLSTKTIPLILLVSVLAACASHTSPEDIRMGAALSAQGKTLLSTGNNTAARDLYLSAVSRDAQNIKAWNGLGVSYDLLHKQAEARDAYQHALDLAPNDMSVANNLAHLYLEEGKAEDAVQLLDTYARKKAAPEALKQNFVKAKKIIQDKEVENEAPNANLGSFSTAGLAWGQSAKAKLLLESMDGLSFVVDPSVDIERDTPVFVAKVEGKNPKAVCSRLSAKGLSCTVRGKK